VVPQRHVVPLSKALSVARGKEEMYEVMMRNGMYLPKKTTALVTTDYLRGILQGVIWVPHQDIVRIKNCP
jgi:hypothetical protein